MEKKELANFEYGVSKNGASIALVPSLNAILLTWKGDVLLEEWIEILSRGLKEIETHKITNWVADTAALGAISDEHNAWVQNVWLPKVMELGLKKLAIILSNDVLGEITMQELIESLKETTSTMNAGLQTSYARNLDEAFAIISK